MEQLKAFHNDEKIKDKYLARVLEHQRNDAIIQGTGWENEKGCAVGCTLENYDHSRYPIELGIPRWLAHVEDKIFEGLSKKEAKSWPYAFLNAINVGASLEKIKIPFLIFIVESARENFDHNKYPKALKSIDAVLKELKRDVLDKNKLSFAKVDAATYAAYAAADAYDAAAAAAAYAAAAYAAAAATGAAAYAAAAAATGAAAYAAAAADAYDDAAKKNTYSKFAKHLLELLVECKNG